MQRQALPWGALENGLGEHSGPPACGPHDHGGGVSRQSPPFRLHCPQILSLVGLPRPSRVLRLPTQGPEHGTAEATHDNAHSSSTSPRGAGTAPLTSDEQTRLPAKPQAYLGQGGPLSFLISPLPHLITLIPGDSDFLRGGREKKERESC